MCRIYYVCEEGGEQIRAVSSLDAHLLLPSHVFGRECALPFL